MLEIMGKLSTVALQLLGNTKLIDEVAWTEVKKIIEAVKGNKNFTIV